MRFISRFFDTNDREVSRLQPLIDEVNALEDEFAALSDDEIRERVDAIKVEIRETAEPDEPSEDELHHPDTERRRDLAKARRKRENGRIQAALEDVIPEVFAAAREASKRTLGMRHFDVQLVGATGRATGAHLHYEVRVSGRILNPLQFLLNPRRGNAN